MTRQSSSVLRSTVPADVGDNAAVSVTKKEALKAKALREGGPLTFNTKFGALNPFAIYYGVTSILLGFIWFAALSGCELLYFLSRGKIDRMVSVYYQ